MHKAKNEGNLKLKFFVLIRVDRAYRHCIVQVVVSGDRTIINENGKNVWLK